MRKPMFGKRFGQFQLFGRLIYFMIEGFYLLVGVVFQLSVLIAPSETIEKIERIN